MNLRNFDLNLLLVFDALFEYRHLSKAGKKLGLSQPAMSHALARLRGDFSDPLFTRSAHGLIPSTRALSLAQDVRRICQQSEALYQIRELDLRRVERQIRIAGTDYIDGLFMPHLAKRTQKAAPRLSIVTRPVASKEPGFLLERGDYDIAIAGFFEKLPANLYRSKLFEETFLGMARADHPIFEKSRVTLASYSRCSHLLISPHGTLSGVVDEILRKKNIVRHIAMALANFQTPGPVIAASDLILTAPRRLVQSFCQSFNVRAFPLPFEIPGFTVAQVWHERTHLDPVCQWTRKQLHEIAEQELKP